ncbi:MAG: GNAT family N-acetyltransferase, partial [bacterium]
MLIFFIAVLCALIGLVLLEPVKARLRLFWNKSRKRIKDSAEEKFSLQNNIVFKPLEEKDLPLFFEWVKKPHVAPWWYSDMYEKFVEKNKPEKLISNYVYPFIIYINNKPIGYIHYYIAVKAENGWWMESLGQPVETVGMEIFIGQTEYVGKGIGTIVVKKFVEKIFKETNAPKIIVDPELKNMAAVRCYEKAGFEQL